MTRTTASTMTLAEPVVDAGSARSGAPVANPARFAAGQVAPADWFESQYATSNGDASRIPWAHLCPNPMMVTWLNAQAPGLVRPGARTVVVGCGLGDDAALLASRGYDVLGFDVSPTGVSWARRRFPELTGGFVVADLLSLPARLHRRFDLVVEVYTLQSLPPALREDAARAVASLCGQRGVVLAIARGRDESELLEHTPGPPWPLTAGELAGLMELGGLRPLSPVEDFEDDQQPPVRRLRGVFAR